MLVPQRIQITESRIKMETNRLIIRSFTIDDVEKCYTNWGQDDSLGKYLIMFPMQSISEMTNLISGFIGNPNVWLMEEKSSHEPIGYVSVDIPYDILGIGEIAYLLGEKYQHRGYALEAMEAVIAYLFMERKLYMIEAKYNEDNIASGNLLKRLGFQVDGILRDRRIDRETGKRSSLVVCSITQNDYSK